MLRADAFNVETKVWVHQFLAHRVPHPRHVGQSVLIAAALAAIARLGLGVGLLDVVVVVQRAVEKHIDQHFVDGHHMHGVVTERGHCLVVVQPLAHVMSPRSTLCRRGSVWGGVQEARGVNP